MKNLPFEQLGQMMKNKSGDDAVQSKADLNIKKEDLKKRFLEITEGNYDNIPMGWQLASDLKGINSTSIIKAPGTGFLVHITYKAENGKDRGYTFSLFPDGALSGNMPKELPVTKEQLYEEVVYNLEAIRPDFWYEDNEKILEQHDWVVSPKQEQVGESRDEYQKFGDRRRIEFLQKQPDALFGFHSKLNKYRGFVFKGGQNSFICLENPKVGNALYVLDLDGKISDEHAVRCKNKKDIIARQEVIERFWKQHEDKGKLALYKTPGVKRIPHAHIDNWIGQVKQILNQRNPLPEASRNVKLLEKRKIEN